MKEIRDAITNTVCKKCEEVCNDCKEADKLEAQIKKIVLKAVLGMVDAEMKKIPSDKWINDSPTREYAKPFYQGKFDVLMDLEAEIRKKIEGER